MQDKNKVLEDFFSTIESSKHIKKSYVSKIEKIFIGHKDRLLDLFEKGNVSIHQVHTDLVQQKILENIPYISFYQWVKRKQKEREESGHYSQNFVEKNVDNSVEDNSPVFSENLNDTTEKFPERILYDSLEMFYGFDMNKEIDEVDNPLPIMYEISKEYIFTIFRNDPKLTNNKLVKIILFHISSIMENIYQEYWHDLLMQEDENIQQYYDRLQTMINTINGTSYVIRNMTSLIQDLAYDCGYKDFKMIRATR